MCITDRIGIDCKIRTVDLDGSRVKLQIWDTAGQERFRTITTAYYRGAMGILLTYDVTDEQSFDNVRNWMRNIEQHATENVCKILVGNKSDVPEEKRRVSAARGKAMADEFGIPFFETSAKAGFQVEDAFFSIARDCVSKIKAEGAGGAAPGGLKLGAGTARPRGDKTSACCGS